MAVGGLVRKTWESNTLRHSTKNCLNVLMCFSSIVLPSSGRAAKPVGVVTTNAELSTDFPPLLEFLRYIRDSTFS